jgi:hypothetical protein
MGVSVLIPRLLLIIAMLVIASTADAQLNLKVYRSGTGGGTITAPSCNNSLDFTQACNSQSHEKDPSACCIAAGDSPGFCSG